MVLRVPVVAQRVKNLTSIHGDIGLIPGLAQWVNLALLWLWCRLETTAPIRPLAWELTYAFSAAPKRPKKKKSIGRTLFDIKCSNSFLDLSPKSKQKQK